METGPPFQAQTAVWLHFSSSLPLSTPYHSEDKQKQQTKTERANILFGLYAVQKKKERKRKIELLYFILRGARIPAVCVGSLTIQSSSMNQVSGESRPNSAAEPW